PRMKARRKMPAGQRDTSSRSSAWRSARLIFVSAAIEDNEICRRSRSPRSRAPKLSSVTEILDLFAAPLLAECSDVDPTPLSRSHKSMSGDRQKTDARDDGGGYRSCVAH